MVPGCPRCHRDAELPILPPALLFPPFPGGVLWDQGWVCSWKKGFAPCTGSTEIRIFCLFISSHAYPEDSWDTDTLFPLACAWVASQGCVFIWQKNLSLCLGLGTASLRAEARFSLPTQTSEILILPLPALPGCFWIWDLPESCFSPSPQPGQALLSLSAQTNEGVCKCKAPPQSPAAGKGQRKSTFFRF